jgi:hypothetical protein
MLFEVLESRREVSGLSGNVVVSLVGSVFS